MGAPLSGPLVYNLAAWRTLKAESPYRSHGFASHPCEWFAFVIFWHYKVSNFCASRYYSSYIYNYMILFSLYAGSLRIGGESHQGTAQVTTIFVSRWLTIKETALPGKETTLPGLLPLSGQSLRAMPARPQTLKGPHAIDPVKERPGSTTY